MCTHVIVSLAWMFFRVAQKCDTRCDTRSHFSPKLVIKQRGLHFTTDQLRNLAFALALI